MAVTIKQQFSVHSCPTTQDSVGPERVFLILTEASESNILNNVLNLQIKVELGDSFLILKTHWHIKRLREELSKWTFGL